MNEPSAIEVHTLESDSVGSDELRPLLDYLRTLPGMSLCKPYEEQVAYMQDDALKLFVAYESSTGRAVGLAGIRRHEEYEFEPLPYQMGKREVRYNVVELCCLAVLPDRQGHKVARALTARRLQHVTYMERVILELRPSEASANRLDVEPEAHESTASLRKILDRLGFEIVGRAPADNSIVMELI